MNVARRCQSIAITLLLFLVAAFTPNATHIALAADQGGYIEGQAIVGVLEGDGLTIQSETPYTVEELMDVSASAADIKGGSAEGLVSQADTRVRLKLVSSPTLTTDELIAQLQLDPCVVFAEPNQIVTFPDALDLDNSLVSQSSTNETSNQFSDLTGIQWGMWDGASYSVADMAANPSVNSPAFGPDARRGDNMASEVVVAVLDMGIDYANPDLTDAVYRFSESEQQQLGCGEWGFNSMGDSTDGVPVEIVKGMDHATHIAGILGASWDGHGISGVASNVKIVNIQIGKPGRSTSLADTLRGFEFIKRAHDAGIDTRVTSSSWGYHRSSLAVNAAVKELGESCGTVCCFSAGNNNVDNALSETLASQYIDNPYAIVVAATDPNDLRASYSSYGETTVDIAAPGSYILSTVPLASATYLPDAMRDNGIFYEGFDGGESNVTASLTYYPSSDAEQGYEGLGEQAQMAAGQEEGDQEEGVTVVGEVTSERKLNGNASLHFPFGDTDPGSSLPIRIDIDLGVERMQQLAEQDKLYLGFSYMIEGATLMSYPDITTNVTGDAVLPNMGGSDMSFSTVWLPMSYDLTEHGPIIPSEDGHLVIDVDLESYGVTEAIYIDSVGIGTTKTPYAFMDGTSMATPLVAGGAAILSSQTGATGAELAAMVRAHVRIPEAGELPVRTGGVLDLSADVSDVAAPHVEHTAVHDGSVVISGSGFGGESGTITLFSYVVGNEPKPLDATVLSWSDTEIVCVPNETYPHILQVSLMNVWGLVDNALLFIDKGTEVYEQDLPFDAGTGEPFVSEATGDFETKGPLVGLGCKLYYLPSHQFIEGAPAHKHLLVFDLKTNTWSQGPEVPEWLSGVSACIYDGKLVVEGSNMYLNELGVWNDTFPDGQEAEERVYVFDPTMLKWTRASNEGMKLGQTIFNDEGTLKLLGGHHTEEIEDEYGYKSKEDVAYPLMSYDLENGVIDEILSDLPSAPTNPSVAARKGTILAYDLMNGCILRIRDGQAEDLGKCYPSFLMGSDQEMWGDASKYDSDPYVNRGSLSPVEGGFILVGPPAKDGSSDTYFMADDSDEFVSYPLRTSEARLFSQTETAYRGRLFVIGSSYVEPGKHIFRATEMSTVEYPGDIPCEPDPEPDPEPEPKPQPQPNPSDPTKPVTPNSQSATTKSSTQTQKAASKLPKTSDVTGDALVPFAAGILALALARMARKHDGCHMGTGTK